MRSAKEPRRAAPRRWLAIIAAASLVGGALASVWGFLAAQSPSSPLHVGPLVGPIESLARACWLAGGIGLSLAAAIPALSLPERDERLTLRLIAAGWCALFASMLTGALLGTTGTQIIEAYPRTVAVMFGKLVGFAVLVAGLVSLLRAVARRGE
jgi:hypothetical protein